MSSSSSSSSSSSISIPSQTSSTHSLSPLHHLITIKLTRDNYLLWKAQIVPYLKGQHLFSFIDGSQSSPPQFLPLTSNENSQPSLNPDFLTWQTQDQMILSAFISSLSENILAYVVKCSTSRDVWITLERMFTAHSRARSMNIHYQLATLKKGDSSVADYFHKFTHLTDTLAAVDQPLPPHEALSFLLAGLGSDYDSLVTSVKTQVQPMSLEDLYGHMLSHELRLAQHQPTVDLSNVSANFTNKGPSNRGGRGGRHSSNYFSNRSGRFSQNNQRGRGRGRQTHSYPSNRPVCQVCQKPGHAALQCYHRFDNTYTSESTPQMQALFATPNYSQDPNWYPDLGATHHLTHDLTNLNIRADEYQGSDQIRVGSGFEASSVARPE
uniref:Retrotransposon Copia-like N-terminal domain-containing protein n=1 Tax=Fagus sylvatica TaxID=28930 RepID=A0A2N9E542_FAGSY